MIELLKRLLTRRMNATIQAIWIPKIGDRIEFIKRPRGRAHIGHEYPWEDYSVEVGDRGIITNIFQPGPHLRYPDIGLLLEDGDEIRLGFFQKEDAIPLNLVSEKRKNA